MDFLKDYLKNFKLNGYLLGECLFFIILSRFGKISLKLFFGLLLLPLIIMFFTALTGKSIVRNFSTRKVYAKCENDSEVFEVERFRSKSFIDGIKVDDKVYKISDGIPVWVFNKLVFYPSFTGLFLSLIGRDKLSSVPDSAWQPLFDKK